MATKFFDTVFGFQSLLLAAVVEAFGIIKLFPNAVPEENPLIYALSRTVLANLILFCVFWGLIYPYALSPIRHFPTASVSRILCVAHNPWI